MIVPRNELSHVAKGELDRLSQGKTFYRVETMDLKTCEIKGGCYSTIFGVLDALCGVPLHATNEQRFDKYTTSEKIAVHAIMRSFSSLMDGLTVPQIYHENPQDCYCLYKWDVFLMDEIYDLKEIDETISELGLAFICKEFVLEEDEIIYADNLQAVISKETYNKHSGDYEDISDIATYDDLIDMLTDEDYREYREHRMDEIVCPWTGRSVSEREDIVCKYNCEMQSECPLGYENIAQDFEDED